MFTGPSQAQFGPLSLVGTRGFSVDGSVDAGETFVGPLVDCNLPCMPASTIRVGAHIGSAFDGNVTLDGQTYLDVSGFLSRDFLDIELFGETIDVPAFQNAAVTISAPFDADGFFRHFDFSTQSFFDDPIQGSGRVTLNLEPEQGGTWFLAHTGYDFATTPEPATLTMVGAPLVAALIRARKRRDRSATTQLSMSTPTA